MDIETITKRIEELVRPIVPAGFGTIVLVARADDDISDPDALEWGTVSNLPPEVSRALLRLVADKAAPPEEEHAPAGEPPLVWRCEACTRGLGILRESWMSLSYQEIAARREGWGIGEYERYRHQERAAAELEDAIAGCQLTDPVTGLQCGSYARYNLPAPGPPTFEPRWPGEGGSTIRLGFAANNGAVSALIPRGRATELICEVPTVLLRPVVVVGVEVRIRRASIAIISERVLSEPWIESIRDAGEGASEGNWLEVWGGTRWEPLAGQPGSPPEVWVLRLRAPTLVPWVLTGERVVLRTFPAPVGCVMVATLVVEDHQ